MDNSIKNDKHRTACHECIYGGNGDRSCSVGKNITYKGLLQRGCWAGEVIENRKENKS